MPRTTPQLVKELLSSNYGPASDGSLPNMQPYIDSASPIIDEAVRLAAQRTPSTALPSAVQELMERWLAAHMYTKMDPIYTSKSAGGASGSFVQGSGEPERFLEGAFNVDYSGTLRALIKRQVASASWIGKLPSEQIPIWDRQ